MLNGASVPRARRELKYSGLKWRVPETFDIGHLSFDEAESDDAVGDVLIRDHRTRIDVAAIDVKPGEPLPDLFEIVESNGLADIGFDDVLNRGVVEHAVAGDMDPAQDELSAPAQLGPGCGGGRQRRRRGQLDLGENRRPAAAVLGRSAG